MLDTYLQRQATQDVRRRIAQVFVARGEKPSAVAGYYTLSATSIDKAGLPPTLSKRLPHYPVPAAILGRLAIDRAHQGQGLGALLLIDAMRRVVRASATLAVHALVVDAKNERAYTFYARYGFQAFAGDGRRMFLTLETIEALKL